MQTIHADLAQPDAFDRIVAAVLDRLRPDRRAGQQRRHRPGLDPRRRARNPIRFWEVAPEQWSRFLAVNATAPIMMARAVLPHMLAAKAGRIITVTTSLGTMVREGYLLYGASKAAAEAAMAGLSADLKGTGVTSNVLVPGGVTNTPLVGEHAGDRCRMLQPEIMVPPLLWLVSDAAAAVNGRRFIAADWDAALPASRRRRRPARRSRGWASRACRSNQGNRTQRTLRRGGGGALSVSLRQRDGTAREPSR